VAVVKFHPLIGVPVPTLRPSRLPTIVRSLPRPALDFTEGVVPSLPRAKVKPGLELGDLATLFLNQHRQLERPSG